ncbi:MAG TPA: hypothetical protein VK327_10115, partial [Candidatus Paceibacterota bacterium]|nr:hypothetical protein [Candidatus Paceibacterota bacterium]
VFSRILVAVLLLPACADAQSYWKLKYQGTETVGGGSNRLLTVRINEQKFIQNCATNSGISTDDLALVLHFDANDVGDALEVINVNDPNIFRCEVFKFAFPESYTNNIGTVMKRFAYIYDDTSGHSRGSVVISRRGKTNAPAIDGKLQYWLGVWSDSGGDPNAIVGSGTFKATGALNFP